MKAHRNRAEYHKIKNGTATRQLARMAARLGLSFGVKIDGEFVPTRKNRRRLVDLLKSDLV
jgi:hypothetical protein